MHRVLCLCWNPSWFLPHSCWLDAICTLLAHCYGAETLDGIFPWSRHAGFSCSSQTCPCGQISLLVSFLFCFPLSNALFFFLLFYCLFYYFSPPLPLQENQRMQQKVDNMTKEVFDLQETLLWKDKNIRVWVLSIWALVQSSLMRNRPIVFWLKVLKICSFDYFLSICVVWNTTKQKRGRNSRGKSW